MTKRIQHYWISMTMTAFFLGLPTVVLGGKALTTDTCIDFSEKGFFKPASNCFLQLSKSIVITKKSTELQRLKKGSFLMNAAKTLHQAAKKESHKEVSAYLMEKATRYLDTMLKEKLFKKVYGRREGYVVIKYRTELVKEIKYQQLAITTSDKEASIRITGYKFQSQTKLKFNQRLRPGKYNIEVTFPGEKAKRTRSITLTGGKALTLSFFKKPPIPAVTWASYAIGGASLVAGAVVLGLGLSDYSAIQACQSSGSCRFTQQGLCFKGDACFENNETRGQNESSRENLTNDALIWIGSGGGALGLGVVFIAVAGVTHYQALNKDFSKKQKLSNQQGRPNKLSKKAKVFFDVSL